MNRKNKITQIIKAWTYKSGEDSCNSVYLGGMEKASVLKKLGSSYGECGPIANVLDDATNGQINRAHENLGWIIDYMEKNQAVKCECCGNVILKK